MAQHAILRFEKHKGNPARPLEAHHERQKEQYASNPDIDTSRSKYNFHIVKPESRYYHFIQNRIEQAGCRTRKDSTRFVDTLITASPEFFKKKPPKEIQEFFHRAADFLIGRVGRENIVSAVVHMDEKTPHLHLVFVPLTEDNRLCAKEIIGNSANLSKWQDDFHAYMVEKYPDLERGESASKTGRKHIPTRLFKQAVNLSKQARAIEATLDGMKCRDNKLHEEKYCKEAMEHEFRIRAKLVKRKLRRAAETDGGIETAESAEQRISKYTAADDAAHRDPVRSAAGDEQAGGAGRRNKLGAGGNPEDPAGTEAVHRSDAGAEHTGRDTEIADRDEQTAGTGWEPEREIFLQVDRLAPGLQPAGALKWIMLVLILGTAALAGWYGAAAIRSLFP